MPPTDDYKDRPRLRAVVDEMDARPARHYPSPKEPMRVAEKIISEHYTQEGVPTLRWWRGAFLEWTEGRWAEVETKTIHARLYALLKDAEYLDDAKKTPEVKRWSPNRYKIADLTDALAAIGHTNQDTATPSWLLGRDGDPPASELVAVGNGLLHVPTRTIHNHTPRLFNTVAVPFPFDPDAPPPARWIEFMGDLWPDDEDAIKTLMEWFGYVISGDTRLHKILFILGPMRSGKGTIARVLQHLVGPKNTCGPTLASLGTNFGLQDIIGKTLAIVADARLGTANANVVVERLLSISGEDSLTIDRKYKDHWFGKLDSRFMILSNELPAFGDASGAIATRFVVLALTRSWLGHENHRLIDGLIDELPGILNWALDGLDRLRAQDRFTEPASARDSIMALADMVSPTSAFVRDRCIVGPEYDVAVDEIYRAWREWCEDQGRDRPGNSTTFGKNLRAVVPSVRRTRPQTSSGEREYRYLGLRLSAPQSGSPRTKWDQDPKTCDFEAPVPSGPRTEPMYRSDAPSCPSCDGEGCRWCSEKA